VHPGDLLSRIMKEMDISSYALAKATGKTPTQIHRIANGKYRKSRILTWK
jgi:plasmid maintenance system antidote protein VapI